MGKFVDLSGQRFGKLTVLERAGTYSENGGVMWRCRCDCGKETTVISNSLRSGKTRSCGCLSAEKSKERAKHGSTGSRLYRIWSAMIERCTNPNRKGYENYGGRGITVYEEWRKNFSSFKEWAESNGYEDTLTIERKDNDKGYSPDNCRWITFKAQQNHKRDNHLLTCKGETHTIAEWSEITGIRFSTICNRLSYGWPIEDVLFRPIKQQVKKRKEEA